MKVLLAVFIALLPATGNSAGLPEDPRIIASVIEIVEKRPPSDPGVCVRMLVHSPTEYRGTRFELFDSTRSRGAVRREFPIGAFFSLQLPRGPVSGLIRYKVISEENDRQLDAGVLPETIRQTPTLPRVEFTKLVRQPSPIAVL